MGREQFPVELLVQTAVGSRSLSVLQRRSNAMVIHVGFEAPYIEYFARCNPMKMVVGMNAAIVDALHPTQLSSAPSLLMRCRLLLKSSSYRAIGVLD